VQTNRSKTEVISNIEGLTFGVEIETTIPRGLLNVGGYHCGANVTTAPSFNRRTWKSERDGSIRVSLPNHEACEFVSPILQGEAGLEHLCEFVTWLRTNGAVINDSCGFHVHVGVAGFVRPDDNAAVADYVAKIAKVASFNSTALYAQTGTLSREKGVFCAKPGDEVKRAVRATKRNKSTDSLNGVSRYQMLNLTTVATKGTVEFRCFAGTLNIIKMLGHILTALLLCRVAAQLKAEPTWENKTLTGREAVLNLFKVRPVTKIVQCKIFVQNFPAIVTKTLEMACKYDAARLGQTTTAND